ncbi:MAG TPA: tetratricopeptide repeat protein, partial [Rhizomicrobium sp.]|nr:tetratricopeptide repeat protein [Rhizomicrobium sp.]
MRRVLSLIAPLLAAVLAGCATQPAPVSPEVDKQSEAFSTYLSARFAAGEHDLPQAARYYGQSLANDPGNPSLLALSFFYSTTSGDFDAAGKYAQAVIVATPDDRAARLALAVIGFKHKDYVDVRKQLSLSAKGPFTALTLSLFDAWAAAAEHDTAGVQKDMQSLTEQKGAESMAAFHTALIQDYLGNAAVADAAYKKALASTAPTPRVLEAYGRFLERAGRGEDASKLYQSHINEGGLASVTRPGLARIAAGDKPEGMIRSPADGAAEALFGIASSLTDAQSSEVSILYLRMALYLRSDLGLAQV